MLGLSHRNGKYFYSIFSHPVSRVMKSELFIKYFKLIDKRDSVLDYGSGDGPYKEMLKHYFEHYVAADYQVTNAHHSVRPDIFIDDNQNVNVDDESFSCVVISEVLEHVYRPHEALQEINRVLSPNGFVIGTVPFFMWEHEKPYDFHRYTYFGLKRMFEDNGFEIVKLDYVGDIVGVSTYGFSKLLGNFIKPIRKIKPLHFVLKTIISIPSLLYYFLVKVKFIKSFFMKYFGEYPFGFVFVLRKSV
ncbi:class I SAM-dependent methyltransferase [uncultured Psychroserpens sp.]|uniref:class I SAM-dependent methyltransferase n=1 Tax=uncultured Psychroserpens sp. TaxID=255436 RepID=UPI00261B7FA7|nr:class I SAM-dependent methyltransferase [uncultured Psychroserpens sp.]